MLSKYNTTDEDTRKNNQNPKIIWLMSFPNSGNSFTTTMVRTFANISTATNYGEEHVNEDGLSEAITDEVDYENGPFLILNSKKKRLQNGRFVLTKVKFNFKTTM